MKVLFMFSGLPHYYNLILSRLNNIPGLEIVVVSPKTEDNQSIGQGVYQTKEGINFKCIFLEQYDTLYKKFFKGFDKVLEEERPDIVVTIFFFAYSFLFNKKVKQVMDKYKIKLIYKDIPFRLPKYEDAIDYYASQKAGGNSGLKKWIYKIPARVLRNRSKKLYNLFDAHVNYVEKGKEIFGSYGVPQEKIFTTYNSIDNEVINELQQEVDSLPPILPPNPYRIFHIGRLVEWKRVDLLIDAVSRLREKYPEIELLIIGKGPLMESLQEQAKRLGLDQEVKFLGAIYDAKVLGQHFKACSVYVLAGMGGLSINEAMAWGLPVICSVCDGTEKHLVKDGYNGKFFEDGNLQDLVKQIDFMLADPERTRKMGQNSKTIIDTKINVHTVLKGYLEAFNYVTNNKYELTYTPPATKV